VHSSAAPAVKARFDEAMLMLHSFWAKDVIARRAQFDRFTDEQIIVLVQRGRTPDEIFVAF
jgi:hypothetical protein